jgi:hypothetical protein
VITFQFAIVGALPILALGFICLAAALKAAGDDLGHAIVAESAPFIARRLVILSAWFALVRAPGSVKQRVAEDLDEMTNAIFADRHSSIDRTRGIFVALRELRSIIQNAQRIVEEAAQLASPIANVNEPTGPASAPVRVVITSRSISVFDSDLTFFGGFPTGTASVNPMAEAFRDDPTLLLDALNATGDWRAWTPDDLKSRNEEPPFEEMRWG